MKNFIKIIVVCCCVFGISACSEMTVDNQNDTNDVVKSEQKKVSVTPQSINGVSSSASWAYSFVIWNNGQTYIISDTVAKADNIGSEIGQVKRDISSFDAISKQDGLDEQPSATTQKDGDSNMLAVGNKIYAFVGETDNNAIVVSYGDKFYKALKVIKE